jgi:glycosyltransferase involved in cell wall biosynthesis
LKAISITLELCFVPSTDSYDAQKNTNLVSVVMAVYNEEDTVSQVIEELLALQFSDFDIELIVVESQSTDSTQTKIKVFESRENVKIIYQDSPRGKGHAVREGLKHVKGNVILIQDADDEYSLSDYPLLLKPILDGTTDFVLGTRHKSGESMRVMPGEPFRSKVLNAGHHFFVVLFNVLYGTKLTDPFTMYKVFRTKCIADLEFYSNRFDFDWELMGKLVRRNYIPIEVPVAYAARGFRSGKKVSYFRDPVTWIYAAFRFRFCKL